MNTTNRDAEIRTAAKEQMIDGPSQALLAFMDQTHGEAPYDWSGYSYDY